MRHGTKRHKNLLGILLLLLVLMIQIDLFEKNLWREIPSTGPYCPTCGFDNATTKFGPMFVEDYSDLLPSGFFFGGGGGAGAPGGVGCCG